MQYFENRVKPGAMRADWSFAMKRSSLFLFFRLVLVLGCMAAFLTGCSRDPNVRKQKYFESGQRFFAGGKYREAVIQFRNATQVDASYGDAHYKLAQTYLKLQDWQHAFVELSRTLELQPDNYKAHVEIANLLIADGNLKLAQEHTDLLLDKLPNDPDTHVAVANLYGRQGKYDLALAETRKAIAIDPGRGDFYLNMALLDSGSNQFDSAETNFKKAIDLKATGANPRLALAAFYQSRGRYPEAEQQVQQVIASDPKDIDSRASLAKLYMAQGKRAEAEQFCKQVKHDLPDESAAYRILGDFYFAIGDLDKAITEYASLYSDHPKDLQVVKNYVQLLVLKNRVEEAGKLNEEALRDKPKDDELLTLRGEIQLGQGKVNEAVQTLQSVVSSNPNSAVAHYQLGNALNQRTFELTENLTIPMGAQHHVTFGTKNLFYRPINLFGQNSMGSWTFNTLAAFQAGTPSSYSVSAPLPTDPAAGRVNFRANMYSFYVQDAWQHSDRLLISAGVRLEKPRFLDKPPENPSVLQNYGRSTSAVPSRSQVSPRVSFNWDITGDQTNQLRGGIGYFTGTPPFVYLSNAFGNSGLSGYASLTCGGTPANQGNNATSTIPPAFNAANIATPPTSCAPFTPAVGATRPGATTAASSNIATIDPNFRFPQYQKISMGYDHRFPSGLVGSLEGLYTKALSNPFYSNLALAGPQGRDRNGRVLYGVLTATGGTATIRGGRQQVIDVTDVHGDYTYAITGTVQKTFFDNFQGSLAYSYSQTRDVAATTSSTQGSNYRYQRDISGYLEDRSLTRGKEDMPHRIIATGTWRLKTLTDFSLVYVGNSGAPFDYVYGVGNGSGSGDANADGQSQNDLVYVPKDAHDPNEILFQGFNAAPGSPGQLEAAAEADAFDRYIDRVACLKKTRGKLLSRNACRNPWQNDVDVSVGQSLKAFGQQNLQLRLDVINFGNLLNKRWGWQDFSDQNNTCGPICSATTLLTQTGNVVAGRTQQTAQGIYTFSKTMKPWNADNASSNYRMQLSLRYSF
jgi:tetratricopeptide (TPR) repeat protein